MLLIDKKGGKNKFSSEKIKQIIKTYLKLKSIQKTAEALKCSKNTVNKYVKSISIKNKKSRYNNTSVIQIDHSTGKMIRIFKNSNIASKVCHISLSNLNQCLNGRTNSAGGYCWVYSDKLENFKLPNKIHQSYIRQEDILLGLA